jgi:hypothetical protein
MNGIQAVFQGRIQVGGIISNGASVAAQYVQELGAVEALDADGICVDATATGAGTLSATGDLTTDGVATFDVSRGVSITSGGTETATFTITGTDNNGNTVIEDIAGPDTTTVYGIKAFKTVTSVAVDGATVATGGVTVGSSNVIGYDYRVADKGKVLGVFVDGVPETTLTVVPGLSATGTSTATTADVRGTFTPNTAPDGSKYYTAVIAIDDGVDFNELNGAEQYDG